MNDIVISTTLTSLIDKAKKIGNKPNQPLTAERFFVAAIEAVLDELAPNDELIALEKLVTTYISHPVIASEYLRDYISSNNNSVFLDDLYMKKKMREAEERAKSAQMSEVTADLLFACIADDPNKNIKYIFLYDMTDDTLDESTEESSEDDEPVIQNLHSLLEELGKLVQEAEGEQQQQQNQKPEQEEKQKQEIPKTGKNSASQASKAAIAELVSRVSDIREELKQSVYGQDNAINIFTTGYFQAMLLSMLDKGRRRPRATFLFAGPPGVGKTLLAEKVAATLKLPFMRFDMSEYADKEANIEFCGSDKVYKNGKSGNVTSFVSANPQCVLLFDEIEKAHLSVIHLFLQMLDAGRLRDNFTDEEVSFTDTIVILTTNAGKQLYQDSEVDLSTVSRKVIVQALQKDINPTTQAPYFPGAICSRFASGNVVMFNHIGAHNLHSIARKEIERHAKNLQKATDLQLNIDERVYTALLFSEGSKADARTIRGRAEAFFNDELYELLRLIASDKVKSDVTDLDSISITIDLSHTDREICDLFDANENVSALVFAPASTVALCENKSSGVSIAGAHSLDDAVEIMKNQSIDFALLDLSCGMNNNSTNLNIEDNESPARDFFKFMRENKKDIPIYILELDGSILTEEEKISYTSQGVRGFIGISKSRKCDFAEQIGFIASSLHQQASMVKLAKENKLVSFETAQTISKNGKNAEIKLFDFRMSVAVDSEDSKNVLSAVSKPNVHFDDVIGAGDAKKELAYFVEYLKNPKKYFGTGVKAPKGVLLYGPPGTGKTMLAKAMACEAGVTFIAAEGNQFLTKFVGEGSEKVHELFRTARKYAPSILFIDEIDAIAKERRGASPLGMAGGEETLTAFLTEMDGFTSDPSRPVFVLAATNFDVTPGSSKSLDAALMRRFDRRVYIDLPNKLDRIRFLEMKIAKNPVLSISREQIENIAMRSTGMSLAELDSAVELALRSAIREGSTKVTDEIFEEAFETFNSGEVKKWDTDQLCRVAIHESGHALLCWDGGEAPSYLTIVARGNHGGYMQHQEQEGKGIYTMQELLAKIRTSLGGRAAEIVYYGKQDGISTGASGDLASATNIARHIICTYGMDEDFGLAVMDSENPDMTPELRLAINRILKEQLDKAISIIQQNKHKIDALVDALMKKNHLNANEIKEIMTSR